jgi:hypothetical protein
MKYSTVFLYALIFYSLHLRNCVVRLFNQSIHLIRFSLILICTIVLIYVVLSKLFLVRLLHCALWTWRRCNTASFDIWMHSLEWFFLHRIAGVHLFSSMMWKIEKSNGKWNWWQTVRALRIPQFTSLISNSQVQVFPETGPRRWGCQFIGKIIILLSMDNHLPISPSSLFRSKLNSSHS